MNIFHIWSALNWWHCTWQASSVVVVTTLCSLRICSILPQLKVWRERRVTQDMFDFSLIFLNIESSIHGLLSWRKVLFCFFFSVSPFPPFLLPRIQGQQGTCSPACPPQANWFFGFMSCRGLWHRVTTLSERLLQHPVKRQSRNIQGCWKKWC